MGDLNQPEFQILVSIEAVRGLCLALTHKSLVLGPIGVRKVSFRFVDACDTRHAQPIKLLGTLDGTLLERRAKSLQFVDAGGQGNQLFAAWEFAKAWIIDCLGAALECLIQDGTKARVDGRSFHAITLVPPCDLMAAWLTAGPCLHRCKDRIATLADPKLDSKLANAFAPQRLSGRRCSHRRCFLRSSDFLSGGQTWANLSEMPASFGANSGLLTKPCGQGPGGQRIAQRELSSAAFFLEYRDGCVRPLHGVLSRLRRITRQLRGSFRLCWFEAGVTVLHRLGELLRQRHCGPVHLTQRGEFAIGPFKVLKPGKLARCGIAGAYSQQMRLLLVPLQFDAPFLRFFDVEPMPLGIQGIHIRRMLEVHVRPSLIFDAAQFNGLHAGVVFSLLLARKFRFPCGTQLCGGGVLLCHGSVPLRLRRRMCYAGGVLRRCQSRPLHAARLLRQPLFMARNRVLVKRIDVRTPSSGDFSQLLLEISL